MFFVIYLSDFLLELIFQSLVYQNEMGQVWICQDKIVSGRFEDGALERVAGALFQFTCTWEFRIEIFICELRRTKNYTDTWEIWWRVAFLRTFVFAFCIRRLVRLNILRRVRSLFPKRAEIRSGSAFCNRSNDEDYPAVCLKNVFYQYVFS